MLLFHSVFSLNISISIQIAPSVHYIYYKKREFKVVGCVWICEKHSAIHMLYNTMGMDNRASGISMVEKY